MSIPNIQNNIKNQLHDLEIKHLNHHQIQLHLHQDEKKVVLEVKILIHHNEITLHPRNDELENIHHDIVKLNIHIPPSIAFSGFITICCNALFVLSVQICNNMKILEIYPCAQIK